MAEFLREQYIKSTMLDWTAPPDTLNTPGARSTLPTHIPANNAIAISDLSQNLLSGDRRHNAVPSLIEEHSIVDENVPQRPTPAANTPIGEDNQHRKSFLTSILSPTFAAVPVPQQEGTCTVCEITSEQQQQRGASPADTTVDIDVSAPTTASPDTATDNRLPAVRGRQKSHHEWFCRSESFALQVGIVNEHGDYPLRQLHTCGYRDGTASNPPAIGSASKRTSTSSPDKRLTTGDASLGKEFEVESCDDDVPRSLPLSAPLQPPQDGAAASQSGKLPDTLVALIIFLLFSVHSLLEGVGLGLSSSTTAIGVGILSHKSLAAFTIGSSLLESGITKRKFLASAILFASMTPIGTLMGGTTISYDPGGIYTGIFSAAAAGTFGFISLQELLPKAFHRTEKRFLKIACLILGTALVCSEAIFHID